VVRRIAIHCERLVLVRLRVVNRRPGGAVDDDIWTRRHHSVHDRGGRRYVEVSASWRDYVLPRCAE